MSIDLHYATIDGDPDMPTLLFLHEGLGCISMWRDFPERLCAATGAPGFLYDRRGHGKSPSFTGPRELRYLRRQAFDELPGVVAECLPDRDYVIIGHSDGGSIGLLHASTRPRRLRALVTIAAHAFVEDATLAGIQAAVEAHAEGKLAGLAKHHGEKADDLFRNWSVTWLAPAYRDWNLKAELPLIGCPVLVLQGEDDQYATPAQVETIVRAIPMAQGEMLHGCGHSPHLDQPDEVIASVSDFLITNT